MLKIGFLGASKTGTAIACYFKAKGLIISGFYSINKSSLADTVQLVGCESYLSVNELVKACDVIFITCRDDKIVSLWEQIDKTIINNKLICHCSGFLNSDILAHQNSYSASLHPLTSISSKSTDIRLFDNLTFAIEGDSTAIITLKQILSTTNNPYIVLDKHKKTQYHIACVMMTSFYIGLYSCAKQLFDKAIIEGNTPDFTLLLALTNSVIQNIQDGKPLPDIITGPLKRNDCNTIQKHMQALAGDDKVLYQILSKQLLNILTFDTLQHSELFDSLQIKENPCLH